MDEGLVGEAHEGRDVVRGALGGDDALYYQLREAARVRCDGAQLCGRETRVAVARDEQQAHEHRHKHRHARRHQHNQPQRRCASPLLALLPLLPMLWLGLLLLPLLYC